MPELADIQAALNDLRQQQQTANDTARTARLTALALREELARVERSAAGEGLAQQIERQISAAEATASTQQTQAGALTGKIVDAAAGLIEISPVALAGQLGDNVPVLMFPVRLETKYAQENGSDVLRVRIFPDDIQVTAHDPVLSSAEIADGAAFWAERSRALTLPADERRAAEQGAWSLLAARAGGPRARFVARQTRPAGWPNPVAAAPQVSRPAAGGVPPTAKLMPDFFMVMALDESGQLIAEARGQPIADRLQMGPDPEAPAASLSRAANGRLAANDALMWLIDYNRALDAGMAVTVPLPGRVPIARVVALGLRFSLAPEAGAKALETLFDEHKFTRGIDLVRQGSPTNNTDSAESAFTTALTADEALVEQEVHGRSAVAVLDHAGKSDSQRLAEAMGIAFDAVKDWPTAEAEDVAHALAMNRALWPATIGAFLKDMTGNRLSAAQRSEIERFGLTYATGRSLLPALRVGSEPYGVLATSDMRSWVEPDDGEGTAPFDIIPNGLRWLREQFEKLEPQIAQVGRGSDPLAMTMRVIGQQASSVSFGSRRAVTDEVSWNTLHFKGVIPTFVLNWYSLLQSRKDAQFAALGINRAGLPFADLTFFVEADPWLGPVIDRDPEVPLSESDGLSRFDGARNYIDWLLTASTAELSGEVFRDADGNPVAAPRALLYRLLRHAWSALLSHSAQGIIARLRPEFIVGTAQSEEIINAGATKVVPGAEAANLQARAIGLTQNPAILGDYVMDLAKTGTAIDFTRVPEALPVQSQRDALKRLAPLPTAVLERLFAEHIDLVSYRLDAWATGLVARRLDLMRRQSRRERGIYIGAYGYVEKLTPKPVAAAVNPEELPPSLSGPEAVTEAPGNGGFVMAPSLTHGVTAAVLRNAYLTHADPTSRQTMSVNLTSRRVRTAMSFIEGMRAGQDLAALLGYQLERGLHENHPGIELDAFIYELRARFPLVSRRLTGVPEGTPAEQIEARNVIDGNDLLTHVRGKAYPYAVGGLPAAGTPAAAAIIAEIDRLADSLDAASDLLTAEGVHQAVTSNIDRARGALAAVTDGEMPPMPDVVATPRSGRVFTQRVALMLPPAAAGWTAPASPRAAANMRLNAWLVAQLPPPVEIGIAVRPSAGAAATLTLDDTDLDAIDIVLMCGDRQGDGSSELERYLADAWRSTRNFGDDVVTLHADPPAGPGQPAAFIVFDAAGGTAPTPLAVLMPQLRALRRLIAEGRGLTAQDFRLPSDLGRAAQDNPKGFALDGAGDIADLPATCAAANTALAAEHTALDAELTVLEPAYVAVAADKTAFNAAAWTAPLTEIRKRLRAIARFGAPEAVPRSAASVTVMSGLLLFEQAKAVAAAIKKRLEQAAIALAPLPAGAVLPDADAEARRKAGRLDRRLDNIGDAARQLLGASYRAQAPFEFAVAARTEIEARIAAPIESDALALEAWMQSLARVRPRIADLALVSAAAQWTTGAEPQLLPVQLPMRAGDPWIGKAWTSAPAAGDIMSVMTVDCPAAVTGPLEGLLVDDWTELVPTPKETVGVTFNYDRPNAAAPQALLLACPPKADGRWSWQELVGTVTDTFDRARLRAIEPDILHTTGLFQALPMTVMPFTEVTGLVSTYLNRDHLTLIQGVK
jgi:hypothetical protein